MGVADGSLEMSEESATVTLSVKDDISLSSTMVFPRTVLNVYGQTVEKVLKQLGGLITNDWKKKRKRWRSLRRLY